MGLKIGSLEDWKPDPEASLKKDEFISWLKEISSHPSINPIGYPVDDGPFVCSLTYRLTAINGIAVKSRARILNSVDELLFTGCTQAKSSDIPDSTYKKFDWTILLGKNDLIKLFEQETWLPDCLYSFRITVDEIQDSYQNTCVKRCPGKCIYLQFGFGPRWEPGFEGLTEEEDKGCDDVQCDYTCYPETHPPLLTYKIRLDGKTKKGDGHDEYMRIITPLIQSSLGIL